MVTLWSNTFHREDKRRKEKGLSSYISVNTNGNLNVTSKQEFRGVTTIIPPFPGCQKSLNSYTMVNMGVNNNNCELAGSLGGIL